MILKASRLTSYYNKSRQMQKLIAESLPHDTNSKQVYLNRKMDDNNQNIEDLGYRADTLPVEISNSPRTKNKKIGQTCNSIEFFSGRDSKNNYKPEHQ